LKSGVSKGIIIGEKRGTGGFGYDPIFLPEKEIGTFAELDIAMKNMISHRGRAFNKLAETMTGKE